MRYTTLGHSGMRVALVALGSMNFGGTGPKALDPKSATAFVHQYAEAGGNFLDTAVNYGDGAAEEIIGAAIEGERDWFVLGTKYGLACDVNPSAGGLHRKNLRNSLERSLRRLRTDHIDVYWVHVWDFLTRPDDVLRALDDAVHDGKVLYTGLSNVPAWIVAAMQTTAELRGWTPFTALQVEYSVVKRDVERELVPMARHFGLAMTAWRPLAGGLLAGERPPTAGRPMTVAPAARRIRELAAAAGLPPSQLALGWLIARGVVPIAGISAASQLAEVLAAPDVAADASSSSAVDGVGQLHPEFPYDLYLSDRLQRRLYGGELHRTDLLPRDVTEYYLQPPKSRPTDLGHAAKSDEPLEESR
jgi:aryl-alcohol dehydrogenase-like predicted oxidoreductase